MYYTLYSNHKAKEDVKKIRRENTLMILYSIYQKKKKKSREVICIVPGSLCICNAYVYVKYIYLYLYIYITNSFPNLKDFS